MRGVRHLRTDLLFRLSQRQSRMLSSCTLDCVMMGAEFMGARIKDELGIIPPAVPPGFGPITTFTLQKVNDDVKGSPCLFPGQAQIDECNATISENFRKSLRHRPWVNYMQFDGSSEEEDSNSGLLEQGVSSSSCLPKGVIRGCDQYRDCQKVTARWRPNDACRPALDEAPVFYPTEEGAKINIVEGWLWLCYSKIERRYTAAELALHDGITPGVLRQCHMGFT